MSDSLDLEARLADLGPSIAYPTVSPDLAVRVSERIEARRSWWSPMGARPIRRSLLVAVAALLLLAAVVAAAGIMLPGLRIVFLPPGASPPLDSPVATPARPSIHVAAGMRMGLGPVFELDEASQRAGFDPLLPSELGPPDEVYVTDGRLTLLWASRPGLPEIAPGVGLLATEFRGSVDPGYYEKQVSSGATTVETVRVADEEGFWLEGAPHAIFYRDASGQVVEESRRLVGDVLIWRVGDLTLRLESDLGRDATIELAESMSPAP